MVMNDNGLICKRCEVTCLHFNGLLEIMSQRNGEKFFGNSAG